MFYINILLEMGIDEILELSERGVLGLSYIISWDEWSSILLSNCLLLGCLLLNKISNENIEIASNVESLFEQRNYWLAGGNSHA